MKQALIPIAFIIHWIIFLMPSCGLVEIQEGESGVKFKRYDGGIDVNIIYGSGIHFIAPWDRMIKYNTSIQTDSELMSFLTKDGKSRDIQFKYTFQCDPYRIGKLHSETGHLYNSIIIKPELRSAVREHFGNLISEEILTSKIPIYENEILLEVKEILKEKYILIHSISINSIE